MPKNFLHHHHYIKILLSSILWILLGGESTAQQLSNWRQKVIELKGDTIDIDTLSIVPHTTQLTLQNNTKTIWKDTSQYHLDHIAAQLILLEKPPADSAIIQYRVLPYKLDQTYSYKDPKQIRRFSDRPYGLYEYQVKKNPNQLGFLNQQGLNYSGTFSRGLAFGTQQDLVVNSNFNLQMAGKLPNNIDILASISDNNIPFQPEGNTQQLQEFDRIFIQLKKEQHVLLMGDYELRSPKNNYFTRYFRKLQGAKFTTTLDIPTPSLVKKKQTTDSIPATSGQLSLSAAAAIAKGNYNRMIFNGQEGNQGPYRLVGANGELIIILLSNSERVFIDGEPLKRGADNDYIIDYNTAEITFTPNRLITKDIRISVEFEYADRNYLRSMYQASAAYQQGRWTFTTNLFSEQDAKNQPVIEEALTEGQLRVLQEVGDVTEEAILPSARPITFNPDLVNYRLARDTLIAGFYYDSVYVFTPYNTGEVYSVQFSEVGEGNGDYILSTTTINQRIFELAPRDSISGARQGKYAPITKLITPLKRQLATFGTKYQIGEQGQIGAELAVSNRDVNTFSEVGDNDDKGWAAFLNWQQTIPLKKAWKSKLLASANYEYRAKTFLPIEVYRNIEFARNWNVETNQNVQEQLFSTSLNWQQERYFSLAYAFHTFLQKDLYQGYKQLVNGRFRKNGWFMDATFNQVRSTSTSQKSRFNRPTIQMTKSFNQLKGWTLGAKWQQEQNALRPLNTDSLAANSFYFDEWTVFLQKPDTSLNKLRFSLKRRYDYAANGQHFARTTIGDTYDFSGSWNKNPANVWTWQLAYRQLVIENSDLIQQQGNRSLLGNWNHLGVIKKGLIRSNIQYQMGSGQVQKKEYVYQQVATGTGNYLWIDDDAVGEEGYNVQELEEFVPANVNNQVLADYIRIILPTNEYEQTNQSRLNWSFNLNPKALWFDAKGWKKYAAYLSTRTVLTANREVKSDSTRLTDFIPFDQGDTTTLTSNLSHLSTIFLNRNNPKWEMSYYWQHLNNQNLLLSGTDQRSKEEKGWQLRYNLNKNLLLENKLDWGRIQNVSKAFANRDYDIRFQEITPTLSYQWNNQLRIAASYAYQQFTNTLPLDPSINEETATHQRFNLEAKYGKALKSSVDARLSFVNISVSPDNFNTSSAAAYTMLEGLQPGLNVLWNILFRTRLAGNIELNINYDGRKTEGNEIQHTGRVSMRAFF